jgi:hypothetical protein
MKVHFIPQGKDSEISFERPIREYGLGEYWCK